MLVARGKHFVLFDEPADKGALLKESYPDLGWATSIEGHPTLPYSVAWRLLLRGCGRRTIVEPCFRKVKMSELQ